MTLHPRLDEDEAIQNLLAEVTDDQWRHMAALATELASGSATPGQWVESAQREDGSWTFPWFQKSPTLSELQKALYDAGLITPILNWSKWWKATDYADGANVEQAPITDLVRILTSVVRGDRFSEGTLAKYVDNGTVPTAVHRLASSNEPTTEGA